MTNSEQQKYEQLLDAAKLALERLIRLGAEDDKENIGPCPACEALRAAIAKAEGK